jgi:perosamine synthetase
VTAPGRLPYGRQSVDEDDVAAVLAVLRSDWLTTGPSVDAFERAFAAETGAVHAVAVNNGTAALHVAMIAANVGPGDEVVVPAITFAATANVVVLQGATPVFADVEPDTLLVDAAAMAARIGPRTRAVVAVDYAGQPCDYDAIGALARRHGVSLVADACHALGGSYGGRRVGALADVSAFSFHPVKAMTTGEGGMVTTDVEAYAEHMRRVRNHGIATDFRQRAERGTWAYEMVELGFNYRLSDIHAALGLSQLRKVPGWVTRRRQLAARYDERLAGCRGVRPLVRRAGREHGYHLYVVLLDEGVDRQHVYRQLAERGIGANVHYLPVHLHPFYRKRFGTDRGLCPVAEAAYDRMLTLPLFPGMTDDDVARVTDALAGAVGGGA